jgi:hypothetical protein
MRIGPSDTFAFALRYGELPAEFTKEVAPGLEFDANGMPKISTDGNPFAENEECRVM